MILSYNTGMADYKKVLVTGDTGFVGRYLKNYLETRFPEVSFSGFTRSRGQDIRNYEQVLAAVQGQDLIINLAGTSDVKRSWTNPKETIDINAFGAVNVFKAGVKFGIPVIHLSSAEVYGINLRPGHPLSEEHPAHPRHPYGISKKAAELYAENLISKGHHVTVLRPFTLYGDGSSETLEKFIPMLVRNALLGKNLPIEGDGELIRDWLFVADLAEAIWQARLVKPGFYNICTGTAYSQNQVAMNILHEIKKIIPDNKSHIITLPHRKQINEIKEYHGDPSKFYQETGWRASTTLVDGIKKIINFYLYS